MSANGLNLQDMPLPPLFKLVDDGNGDVFEETEVGGEPSTVGALFASRELAEEFSGAAEEFGMEVMHRTEPRELPDWDAVEAYAASGPEYILVVSERETGLFHAGDVVQHALKEKESLPFPLYLLTDEEGESPLISVDDDSGVLLVAALFSSPEKARSFKSQAAHLELPNSLGTIEDTDGLGRHARIAQRAGADYIVVDPGSGLTEAIPVEEWIR